MDFSSLPKSKELECTKMCVISITSFTKVSAMVKCGCDQSWWCFRRWKSNENEAMFGWVHKKRRGQRFTAVPSLLLVLCSAWGSMCWVRRPPFDLDFYVLTFLALWIHSNSSTDGLFRMSSTSSWSIEKLFDEQIICEAETSRWEKNT